MTGDERGAPGASSGDCAGDVCATCSDAAVAGTVIALLDGDMAVVGTLAGPREVSVALVRAVAGGTVLVHAGEAIAVVR